ncbi:MAG: L-seryl-tRNA(Sec) selenium transferase [Vicinamibacterales bacterium]
MTPRQIPSIEQLRQRPRLAALEMTCGRDAVVRALRTEADAMRRRLSSGQSVDDVGGAIEAAVSVRLTSETAWSLRPVINATGVIIHTNLGRAPLAAAATARAALIAGGYSNLEYDLETGRRGARDVHAERLLTRLTGAAAAAVVNNNAAATLLVLAALAAGREVIIGRGELVEIGGGFRIPDVLAQSGARLREVGTTNRTRVGDYAAAISDRTALILRVHPSNFRVEGFVERPSLEALVALGRRFSVPVVEDQGSGYLGYAPDVRPLRDEPDVRASVASAADAVLFSGDKLLGGPQCGLIVGTAATVAAVRRHPLMRAFRVDKMITAALEATLAELAAGRSRTAVPVAAMISLSLTVIGQRADALAARLTAVGVPVSVVDGLSTIGGGSAPGSELPTRLVAVTGDAVGLERALRAGDQAIIARIEHDRLVLDLRTVPAEHDDQLASAVAAAFSSTG